MNIFLQAAANGIMVGGIYALIDMSLTLIFGVMKTINFYQDELLILGMYISFVPFDQCGLDPFVAIPIMAVVVFAFGALLQSTLITRSLHENDNTNVLFLTVGLGILFQNVALLYFKLDYRTTQGMFSEKIVQLGAIGLSLPKVLSFVILLTVTILLFAFLKYTNIGKQIRATSRNSTEAQVCGIKARTVYVTAYGLGAAITGITGTCLMPFYYAFLTVGAVYGTGSFIVVTMSGLGSVIGAFVSGVVLGFMETVEAVVVGFSFRDIIVFLTFILILVVKQTVKTRRGQITMKKRIGSRQILLLILLLVAAVIPVFVRIPYLLSVCVITFYMASTSLAWSILGGLTDQISLGHISFTGLGAYTSTFLLVRQNVSPWISIPPVFLFAGVLTALLLSPCFILREPYFSLVTIVFGEALRNLMTNWDFTGKEQRLLLPFDEGFLVLLRFKSRVPHFYLLFLMAIAVHLIARTIDRSKFGYALKAVREDEDTTNAVGINPLKYRMLATFVSCGLIAVCGVFCVSYIRFVNPDIMTQAQSVEFVLPAIIGGIGSMTGPLIGAIILTLLAQYFNSTLSSIVPGANLLIYAIVLIMVILFRPRDIMGWYNGNEFKAEVDEMFDRFDDKE